MSDMKLAIEERERKELHKKQARKLEKGAHKNAQRFMQVPPTYLPHCTCIHLACLMRCEAHAAHAASSYSLGRFHFIYTAAV